MDVERDDVLGAVSDVLAIYRRITVTGTQGNTINNKRIEEQRILFGKRKILSTSGHQEMNIKEAVGKLVGQMGDVKLDAEG